ncbi:MAG: hypothetical protein SFW67_28120 [Myxococcaceae bacterium]|nr:hypothetical protein [Myxococcaceae bacterium]
MTEPDLEVRRPLWNLMSDLFLDTETRWAVPLVARACATSQLSDAQLDEVFWCEVFPLAIDNLHDIAGEWAMLSLPESHLIARAGKGERRTEAELTSGWMVRDQWTAVKACAARLRREPSARWQALVMTWDALGHRYFEEPHRTPVSDLTGRLNEFRGPGVEPDAEWRFYEPIVRPLLFGDEPHTPREQTVLALIRSVITPTS